jgi:nucleotide-binding universal stress UspA family protein
MPRSIICGVDGSPDAQAALKVAAQFAERLGSTLILCHVAEPAHVRYAAAEPFGGAAGATAMVEETASQAEAGARLLHDVAVGAGLDDAERRVAIGDPAERLAELADEEGAECVVVGSRGRGALKAAFLGSVSYSLVGIARCPVLIIPAGASEAQ